MHQITLQQARLNMMFSLQDVSIQLAIPIKTLKRWEINCGRADIYEFARLLKFYRVCMSHVYIGKAVECPTIEGTLVKILQAAVKVDSGNSFMIDMERVVQTLKELGCDSQEVERYLESTLHIAPDRQKNALTAANSESDIA